MPKQKRYKQKFKKEWLENELFKKWLIKVSNNPKMACCKFCKCEINEKYSDIIGYLKAK